jgi:hypothetical protein
MKTSSTSIAQSVTTAPAPSQVSNFFKGDIAVVTVLLLTLSAILAQIYIYLPKLKIGKSTVKNCSKVKCDGCQYFHNNLYLKCALHPADAMTDRAIDCQDFEAKVQTLKQTQQSSWRQRFNLFDN